MTTRADASAIQQPETIPGAGGATHSQSPASPIRVMRVMTRLGGGGPPIHALLLTRSLNALGYDSVLAVGSPDPEHDIDMTYLVHADDRLLIAPRMSRRISPLGDLASFLTLRRAMRAYAPLIVHTHTAKAGVIGRLAALSVGVPVLVHTYHGNVFRGYFGPVGSAICRIAERVLGRFTTRICVLSQEQATEIASEFRIAPLEKIAVVPLGLELGTFASIHRTTRRRGAPFRAAWIGRFVPVKDVPLLEASVDRALGTVPDIEFLVAGDGPERHRIFQLVGRARGRVHWLGWTTDIENLLRKCDVAIQTSKTEGTPVALIQAMAAGIPFVSTPAGGVVDMCVGSGVTDIHGAVRHSNGILARPDPDAFASALRYLEANPDKAAEMGQAGRRFAVAQYSAQRLIADIDALYRRLLDEQTSLARSRRSA